MFNKIALIDDCGLTEPALEKLPALSSQPITIHTGFPKTDDEIIARIGDADCILVSWRTKINARVLAAAKPLKFVAMCCSLYDEKSANVDIATTRQLGIDVKGVRDYGDEGTVEFIFAQLISLFKGLGTHQWRALPTELGHKHLGIIGMGTLGRMVAETALHFGMRVSYFSRTRKPKVEARGISYLALNELLSTCDVISLHLPKNISLLGKKEFAQIKPNVILVNTSLGLPYEQDAFHAWLRDNGTSFAILDAAGIAPLDNATLQLPNLIFSDQYAGFTAEARQRLSEKVLQNLTDFLAKT